MSGPARLEVIGVGGLGEVRPGDDVAVMVADAAAAQGTPLQAGDVVVVTQKVVSKAEGCLVDLATVEPSPLARNWAARWAKDARVVELVLRESVRIVRMERGVIIAETRHGFVCANAGVDASNVGTNVAALLPPDPDASAERLRQGLILRSGADPLGVVISDTFGRAWREGQTDVAIGVAGVEALRSYEGLVDPTGYELRVTKLATADEIAGAAELVMGKLERAPAAIVRGLARALERPGTTRDLLRTAATDMFR